MVWVAPTMSPLSCCSLRWRLSASSSASLLACSASLLACTRLQRHRPPSGSLHSATRALSLLLNRPVYLTHVAAGVQQLAVQVACLLPGASACLLQVCTAVVQGQKGAPDAGCSPPLSRVEWSPQAAGSQRRHTDVHLVDAATLQQAWCPDILRTSSPWGPFMSLSELVPLKGRQSDRKRRPAGSWQPRT